MNGKGCSEWRLQVTINNITYQRHPDKAASLDLNYHTGDALQGRHPETSTWRGGHTIESGSRRLLISEICSVAPPLTFAKIQLELRTTLLSSHSSPDFPIWSPGQYFHQNSHALPRKVPRRISPSFTCYAIIKCTGGKRAHVWNRKLPCSLPLGHIYLGLVRVRAMWRLD